MGDKKAVRKSFGREQELLKLMMPSDEDVALSLSNLNLKDDEVNLVVHGPLMQPFYAVNCPFVWSEYTTGEKIESCIKDFEEKSESDDMTWKRFCYKLYMSFLYARLGKLSIALNQLQSCEEELQDGSDEFYTEISDGLNHCIQASRAHIYFLKGDTEMADDLISKVHPLKELNNPSKGALIALNAAVLQVFSRECREMALEMMHTAIKLDPDDDGKRRGGWYYTVGKLMGQLRRMDHRIAMPSREELMMLERATKVNPLPVSLAALADAYREAISCVKFENSAKISQELSEKMLSESKRLYKKAFEMDSENSSTLRRCGNGLMKLPPPYKDIPLAKQCLLKSVSVNPRNSSAFQSLGTMEDRYSKNPRGALKYYKLAYENGNAISALFMLEVNMKIDWNYCPLADIEEFSKSLTEHPEVVNELLVLKGEYLFFLKNDIYEAAKCWKEAILMDPESENITKHMSRFINGNRIRKPYLKSIPGRSLFNVYKCLQYEIGNALRRPQLTDEKANLLKEVLTLCENNCKD